MPTTRRECPVGALLNGRSSRAIARPSPRLLMHAAGGACRRGRGCEAIAPPSANDRACSLALRVPGHAPERCAKSWGRSKQCISSLTSMTISRGHISPPTAIIGRLTARTLALPLQMAYIHSISGRTASPQPCPCASPLFSIYIACTTGRHSSELSTMRTRAMLRCSAWHSLPHVSLTTE